MIQELFFGVQNNVITCEVCGESRVRTDRFLDLGLQVQGCKGVQESLDQLFTFEKFDGDNKLTCESAVCNGQKTESRKGIEIAKLPPVLTFCLYRFELDYQTWERKKVNDRFEYPLELDMSKYMSEEALKDLTKDDMAYELKSIVIHRGGAYGGHYWAYIKDDLQEGSWHLDKPAEFHDAPTEIKKKKFDVQDYMTEQQKKELDDEKNKNNPDYDPEGNDQNQNWNQTQGGKGKKNKNKQKK